MSKRIGGPPRAADPVPVHLPTMAVDSSANATAPIPKDTTRSETARILITRGLLSVVVPFEAAECYGIAIALATHLDRIKLTHDRPPGPTGAEGDGWNKVDAVPDQRVAVAGGARDCPESHG